MAWPRRIMVFVLLLGFWGCASYTDEMKGVQRAYLLGDFQKALEKFEELELEDQSRNRLLYHLEKSSLQEALGQSQKARQSLQKAASLVDELYRASLSGQVASFLYNDSTTDYQGEDYEKVLIHTMLALSFLKDGLLNEAQVEARAINTQLLEINNFYKDNKNKYREDAFARFLAGLTYEAKGEWDAAIIDYRAALKIYSSDYKKHFQNPVPMALVKSLAHLAKRRGRLDLLKSLKKDYPSLSMAGLGEPQMSSIVVIHSVGQIASKESKEFVTIWDQRPLRFSFPTIRPKNPSTYGTQSLTIDGRTTQGELTQNLDAIASQTLEDARLRSVAKTIARLIAKDQLAQKAKKSIGPLGGLMAGIYGAVTETADTRSWTLLPGAFYVSRAFVKPGELSLRITSRGRTSAFRKLTTKPGQLYFLFDSE